MNLEWKVKTLFAATKQNFKWEDTTTIETSWGFRREMQISEVKSPSDLIHLLIRTVRLVDCFV